MSRIEVDYLFQGEVVRVIDGDTVECMVDLGFHTVKVDRFRLARINTPEVNSKDPEVKKAAIAAQSFVRDKVFGKGVFIRTKKTDKYGRYVAEIYFNWGSEQLCLNDVLIEQGHATPYTGG